TVAGMAGSDGDVLLAIHIVADGRAHRAGCKAGAPQKLTGFGVDCLQVAVCTTREHQARSSRHQRSVVDGFLLVAPHGFTRLDIDRVDTASLRHAVRQAIDAGDVVAVDRIRNILTRSVRHAGVGHRHEHDLRVRVVGRARPVASTEEGRAVIDCCATFYVDLLLVDRDKTLFVDAGDDVLISRVASIDELARCGIELPQKAGLAGYAGQNATLARGSLRVDCLQRFHRIRRIDVDRVDDHLEGAFLVPVVAGQGLVLPHDLAGLRLYRVAGVRAVLGRADHAALHFRCRAGGGGTVIDQVVNRIVGHLTPGARHPTLFVGAAAPGLVTLFTWLRNEVVAPQFLTGLCIMAGHIAAEARILAGGAENDNAVGDDRTRRVGDALITLAAVDVEYDLAVAHVERDQVVVPGGKVDVFAIDGDAALAVLRDRVEQRRIGVEAVAVLPEQVAGNRIDGLNGFIRAGDEHD